jgi:hypothetical protein
MPASKFPAQSAREKNREQGKLVDILRRFFSKMDSADISTADSDAAERPARLRSKKWHVPAIRANGFADLEKIDA